VRPVDVQTERHFEVAVDVASFGQRVERDPEVRKIGLDTPKRVPLPVFPEAGRQRYNELGVVLGVAPSNELGLIDLAGLSCRPLSNRLE